MQKSFVLLSVPSAHHNPCRYFSLRIGKRCRQLLCVGKMLMTAFSAKKASRLNAQGSYSNTVLFEMLDSYLKKKFRQINIEQQIYILLIYWTYPLCLLAVCISSQYSLNEVLLQNQNLIKTMKNTTKAVNFFKIFKIKYISLIKTGMLTCDVIFQRQS